MKNFLFKSFVCIVLVFISTIVTAQPITGIKTVGGINPDYANIHAAINALNTNGTAFGGVIFDIAAGHTEIALNITLTTTTGTDTSQIVFRKVGIGPNPLIVAGTGTSTTVDAVIKIAGTDYITFDGIDIFDDPTNNTTNTTRMEWGYAIVKGSATNGSQHVTIKNCNITLQKANIASRGIYSGNHIATTTTALTINTPEGTNSYLNLHGNTITDAFNGIFITGATNMLYFDDSINIGGVSGNIITNFGGSGTSYGIYVQNFANVIIKNDSIHEDVNNGSTSSTTFGIYTGNSINSNAIIENNYVQITINGTSSTRAGYGIYCLNGTQTNNNYIRIADNIIKNMNLAASTTILSAIFTSSTAQIEILNNIIDSFTRIGTSGNTQLIHSSLIAASRNISGNIISNINVSGTSAQIRAISVLAGGGSIFNNNIQNIQTSGTSADARTIDITGEAAIFNNTLSTFNHASSSTGTFYLIQSLGGDAKIYNNTISTFATGGSTLIGIELGGTTGEKYEVYRNKISLSSSTNNSCIVSGIRQSNNSHAMIYNNLVGPLNGGPSTTVANGVNGINISTTSPASSNIYHNNVFLNTTTSGGTNCILLSITTDATVINNILINLSANSTTLTRAACAIRRTSDLVNTYNELSDNNLLFVGQTPTANRFVFADGTNNFTDLNTYKQYIVNRDQSSISNNVLFSTTNINSPGYLLPIDTSYIESMGKIINLFTADFVSDSSRAIYPQNGQLGGGGIAPDIGAFEIDMLFIDLVPPSIVAPILNRSLVSSFKTLEPVFIADNSGINTSNPPRLYFKKTSNSNSLALNNGSTSDGWKYVTAIQIGQHYSFFIDYNLLHPNGLIAGGDTIEYFIVAQDGSPMQNVGVSGATLLQPISSTLLIANNFPASNTRKYRILANPIPPFVVIGGIGADYPSLTQPGGFFEAINNGIVDNNIVATINGNLTNENGVIALEKMYEEGFNVGSNHITIQPGGQTLFEITGTNTTGGIIRIIDSERLSIDGAFSNQGRYLHFNNLANTGNRATIQLIGTASGGGNNYVSIKNCIIQGNANNTTGSIALAIGGNTIGIGTGAAQGLLNRNIQITGNHIYSAYHGILINGNIGLPADSLTITHNLIGNDSLNNTIFNSGVYARGMTNSTIGFNKIQNVMSNATTGVFGININSECNNLLINGNQIDNISHLTAVSAPAYGVYSNATTVHSLVISNNIITRVLSQGGSTDFATAPVGIFLNNGNNSFVLNNTVSLSGNRLNHVVGNAYSACLYVRSPITNLTVANNIFRNMMGSENLINPGSNFALATSAASIAAFTYLNHNIYEVGSPTTGVNLNLGINGTNLRPTLQAWRTFSNLDSRSFWGNPGLINDSIPLPDTANAQCWMANGRGMPFDLVTNDFYNTPRSNSIQTGSVDIGAVSFNPTVLPPPAVPSAAPIANTTTHYTLWNDTIGSVNWLPGTTIPSFFEFRYFSGTTPPSAPSNSHFDAFWDFIATPSVGIDYELTLHYKPEAMYTIDNDTNISVAYKDNLLSWLPMVATSVTSDPLLNRITISNFALFTALTGTNANNPLPVKLISFEGNKVGSGVLLKWTTSQSINFSHFEVEHSTDNKSWYILNKIDGSSYLNNVNYQYMHTRPSAQNYYRLNMIDNDGSYTYSKTVSVQLQQSNLSNLHISATPNPVSDRLTIRHDKNMAIDIIGIYDMMGKNVTSETTNMEGNQLDISKLKDGIYFIHVFTALDGPHRLKVIKHSK
jgi:hypothetical protein